MKDTFLRISIICYWASARKYVCTYIRSYDVPCSAARGFQLSPPHLNKTIVREEAFMAGQPVTPGGVFFMNE